MRLAKERPLLREGKIPRAVFHAARAVRAPTNVEDMLHHARFLIVRFFDEKGVVLDTVGRSFGRWFGARRNCQRKNGQAGKQVEEGQTHSPLFTVEVRGKVGRVNRKALGEGVLT